MKKVSLIISFVFLYIASFAQTSRTSAARAGAANVQFGIKAGVNLADTKDEAVPTTDSRTGYHVGALAHIHLSPALALQPEVMYSLQGAEYPNGGRNKLNYINVPIILQYMHTSGFRVQTGPQVGVLTGAIANRGGVDVNVEGELSSTDLSWAFGASYLSPYGLGVDARYNLGLSDNRQQDNTPLEFKNKVWQFGLFYQFKR